MSNFSTPTVPVNVSRITPKTPAKPQFGFLTKSPRTRGDHERMSEDLVRLMQDVQVNSSIAASFARRTSAPPKFNPLIHSFESFLRSLNDYLNANRLDMKEGIRILPSLLDEESRDAYDSIERTIKEEGPWETLTSQLQEKIYSKEKKALCRQQMMALRQEAGEKVASYAKRCSTLAQKAYPGSGSAKERDVFLLSSFLNGLHRDLARAVYKAKIETYQEAKLIAEHEEAVNLLVPKEETSSLNKFVDTVSALIYRNYAEEDRGQNNKQWKNNQNRSQNHQQSGNGKQWNSNQNRQQGQQSNSQNNHQQDQDQSQQQSQQKRNGSGKGNWRGKRNNKPRNNGNNHSNQQGVNDIQETKTNGLKLWNLITLATTLCLISLPLTDAHTYYSCEHTRGGLLVAPPLTQDCTPPSEPSVTLTNVRLFTRNVSLMEIKAFRCSFEIYQQCTTGRLGYPSYNESLIEIKPTTAKECQESATERLYEGKAIVMETLGVYRSPMPDNYPETSFWSEACRRSKRFVLEKGNVGFLPDRTVISNLLLNTENCSIHDGQCLSSETTVVWTAPSNVEECSYIDLGTHSAMISKELIVIENLQAAYHLEKESVDQFTRSCFKESIFKTSSGTYIMFPQLNVTTVEEIISLSKPKERFRRSNSPMDRPFIVVTSGLQSLDPVRSAFGVLFPTVKEFKALRRNGSINLPDFDNSRSNILGSMLKELVTDETVMYIGSKWEISEKEDLLLFALLSTDIELSTHSSLQITSDDDALKLFRKAGMTDDVDSMSSERRRKFIRDSLTRWLFREAPLLIAETGIIAKQSKSRITQVRKMQQVLDLKNELTANAKSFEHLLANPPRHLSTAGSHQLKLLVSKRKSRHEEVLVPPSASPATVSSSTPPTPSSTERPISTTRPTARPTPITRPTERLIPTTTTKVATPSTAPTFRSFSASMAQLTTTPYPLVPTTTPASTTSTRTKATVPPTTFLTPTTTATMGSIDTESIQHLPREIRSTTSEVTPPVPAQGIIGSGAHTNYMEKQFDVGEDQRRELTNRLVNDRQQYGTVRIQDQLADNFKKTYRDICAIQQRQIGVWWALLQLSPTIGMRSVLNRPDISAHFVGQGILNVQQCIGIHPLEIIKSHRINETCYLHTPIRTENDLIFFAVAGTQDVLQESPTINCGEVQDDVYQDLNGTWRWSETEVNITNIPGFTLQQHHAEDIVFSANDIYSKARGSSFPLQLAISYGASLAALQQQQQALVRVISRKRLFGTDGSKLKSVNDLIAAASDKAADVKRNMEGFLNWLSPTKIIIAVSILIAVILKIVVVVAAIKVYCFRKATRLLVNNVELQELSPIVPSAPEEQPVPPERQVLRARPYSPPMIFFLPILLPFVCAVSDPGTLPYVAVTLEDRATVALWDTGSTATYLRRSVAEHIGVANRIRGPKIFALAANGTTICFDGVVSVNLRICGYSMDHTFKVSSDENCPAPVLIGNDLMGALEDRLLFQVLRHREGTLKIGEVKTKLLKYGETAYRRKESKANAIAANSITLLPQQSAILQVQFDIDCEKDNILHLQTPSSGPFKYDDTIAHLQTLETVTRLKVTNIGEETLQIDEGDHLGQATQVERVDSRNKTFAPDFYIPEEANWEKLIIDIPGKDYDYMSDLNLSDCAFTGQYLEKLKDLLRKHKPSFFNNDENIGCFRAGVEHRIDLIPDCPTTMPRPYRVPLGKVAEVERQVQQLLKQKVIERACSPWNSPIVLIRKKDGTYRFCTDFRFVNSCTKKEKYVLPHVFDLLNTALEGTYFTSLDMFSGFFQLNLRKKDRPITAFTTPSGQYQYCRAAQGLCGSPNSFQRAARVLQGKVKCKLLMFLDGLLILHKDRHSALDDISEVLQAIEDVGWKLKISKCKFICRELKFLGMIVTKNGLKPDPKKISSIMALPIPLTPTAVRSFLGTCNYFRRFISKYAEVSASLNELTKKNVPFLWTEEHTTSFEKLKKLLCSAPVLRGPLMDRKFIIECDSSSIAMGGVLLQSEDIDGMSKLHPIAYCSRKLKPAERRYAPIESESLALLFCVSEFRHFILGNETVCITDHRAVVSILTRKDLVGRCAKFQMCIQEYLPYLAIIYRPGRLNNVSDHLSRYFPDETKDPRPYKPEKAKAIESAPEEALESNTPSNVPTVFTIEEIDISVEHLVTIQSSIQWIQETIAALELGTVNKETEKLFKRFSVQKGLLCTLPRKNYPPSVILPKDDSITGPIIAHFHRTSYLGAHAGITRTMESLKRRFSWTGMVEDIRNYVENCLPCQTRKTDPHQSTKEPLGCLPTCNSPFSRLSVDILGPLPVCEGNSFRYILTAVCSFSKWCFAIPLITQTAEEVAKRFLEEIFLKHGSPQIIQTDNGSTFTSQTFKTLCQRMGSIHITTSPYVKQSAGQVERLHRTVEEALSSYVNKTQTDWSDYLPFIIFALNTLPSEALKLSPFFVLYGREARLPEDQPLQTSLPSYATAEDFILLLKIHQIEVWEWIKNRLTGVSKQYQEHFNRIHRTFPRDVQEDDIVLIRRASPKNKLCPYLEGPCTVKKVYSREVEVNLSGKIVKVHKDNIRIMKRPENIQKDVDSNKQVQLNDPTTVDPTPSDRDAGVDPAARVSDQDADLSVSTPSQPTNTPTDPPSYQKKIDYKKKKNQSTNCPPTPDVPLPEATRRSARLAKKRQ